MGKLSKILLNSILFFSAHANNFDVTSCSNDVSTLSWVAVPHSYWILRELCLWKSIKIILKIILSTTVHTLWLHLMGFIRKPSLLTIYLFPMMLMVSNRENFKNCNASFREPLGLTCSFRYNFEPHCADDTRHSIFNWFFFHQVIIKHFDSGEIKLFLSNLANNVFPN